MRATADLADRLGDAVRACDLQFRHFGSRLAFEGRVATVRCEHDNRLMRSVLDGPGSGRVLVVDGGGSLHTALMGDTIAAMAASNGWEGVVIHGAVRDVSALRDVELGIMAMGSNPRRSQKAGRGEIEVPVTFGGVTFAPGDELVADQDGLVAL